MMSVNSETPIQGLVINLQFIAPILAFNFSTTDHCGLSRREEGNPSSNGKNILTPCDGDLFGVESKKQVLL